MVCKQAVHERSIRAVFFVARQRFAGVADVRGGVAGENISLIGVVVVERIRDVAQLVKSETFSLGHSYRGKHFSLAV